MKFEWDDAKAEAVWRNHGIKFVDAILVFSGRRIEKMSAHAAEKRWITVGQAAGRVMTVIYTKRGDIIRLITARRARKDEERAYHSHDP